MNVARRPLDMIMDRDGLLAPRAVQPLMPCDECHQSSPATWAKRQHSWYCDSCGAIRVDRVDGQFLVWTGTRWVPADVQSATGPGG